jgi:RNA polymerase sigma-70 factor (ECF subfamily)
VDLRSTVEQARRGDHDAFASLVHHSIGRQDALARVVLRDPELARDAVQEALIRAWRDLPGLRDPDRFEAWLYRLTLRSCVDEARRRRRRVIEVELSPIRGPLGADPADAVTDHDALETAFAALDPDHRALVLMHVHLGVPVPEAAAALGIPLGTAKSRISRALTQMRRAIGAVSDPGPGQERVA